MLGGGGGESESGGDTPPHNRIKCAVHNSYGFWGDFYYFPPSRRSNSISLDSNKYSLISNEFMLFNADKQSKEYPQKHTQIHYHIDKRHCVHIPEVNEHVLE